MSWEHDDDRGAFMLHSSCEGERKTTITEHFIQETPWKRQGIEEFLSPTGMSKHGIYCIENVCGVGIAGPGVNSLKCRLYPNERSLSRGDFDLQNFEEYEDKFFDTFDFKFGKRKTLIRKRGDKIVRQRTRDVSQHSYCYDEESSEISETDDLKCFVSYRFRRYPSLQLLFEGYTVMLDEIIVERDTEEIFYSVVTLSKTLPNLSSAAVANELQNLENMLSTYGASMHIDHCCLPTWSKFMFAVKTSSRFVCLESVFNEYSDNVSETMFDVISNVSNDASMSKYAKDYIWTVSYGLEYLQAMIHAGKSVEEAQTVFFKDKRDLLADKDVYFAACVDIY